ncbi:MAG: dephospho-CoA kinase [Scytolyngbya sp. HA4215-MV1]|jgi:dephospho-CoA kinase|nr:dephospho-CoA kinase [Scytolyngbya sp. HA4215-MV1]
MTNPNRSQTQLSQRLIGVTGSIGMGKTTVSDYLAKIHHLPVLDADIYAREAVQTGKSALAEMAERYGSGILLSDGNLNRRRLGEIIFNSPAERLWVEQKIHPYVRDRLETALKTAPLNNLTQYPIVIMVIPLLFEARMTDLVTETWVIYCSLEQQIDRLMRRDCLTLEEAQIRINSQMAIQKKVARASVVLDNSFSLENLFQQIDQALAHPPSTKDPFSQRSRSSKQR